jgi:hypothetical protein
MAAFVVVRFKPWPEHQKHGACFAINVLILPEFGLEVIHNGIACPKI